MQLCIIHYQCEIKLKVKKFNNLEVIGLKYINSKFPAHFSAS